MGAHPPHEKTGFSLFGSTPLLGGMETPGQTPAQRVVHTSNAFFQKFLTLFLVFSVTLTVYTLVWEAASLYAGVVCLVCCAVGKALLRAGRLEWVRWVFMVPLLAMLLVAPWWVNGIRTPLLLHSMLVLIFASWMLGTRAMWGCCAALLGQIWALWYAEKHGLWVMPQPLRDSDMWMIALVFSVVVTASMMSALIHNYRADLQREALWQQQLRQSLQFNTLIIDSSPVPIRVFDAQGQCIAVNPAYAQLVQQPREVLLQLSLREQALQSTGLTDECLQALRTGKACEREVSMRTADGRVLWLQVHLVPFERKGQRHLLAHFIDITERYEAAQELQQLAFHDALTELPNRRLFSQLLQQGIQQCRRSQEWGAVFMVDLNHFKALNDSWGHDAGDQLLQAVAQRLRQSARGSDVVARLGGDEFTVLVNALGSSPQQAEHAAQQLRAKLQALLRVPYELQMGVHHGSGSVGFALIAPDFSGDAAELLRQADAAMYAEKKAVHASATV